MHILGLMVSVARVWVTSVSRNFLNQLKTLRKNNRWLGEGVSGRSGSWK